jgi:hypothetical protein
MHTTLPLGHRQIVRWMSANDHSLWSIDDLKNLQLPDQYKYILDIFNKCKIKTYFTKDGILKGFIIDKDTKELIDRNDWFQFNKHINHRYRPLLTANNNYHKYLQYLYKTCEKYNKITYIQENMNMQLEDKDYISENKILKNQINDQEEIIKQLLERLEILDKKDKEKNKNTLFNMFT